MVDTLLTRVTTDDGLEAWGESFGFVGLPVTRTAIDDVIAPLCVGRDPSQIGPLMGDVQERRYRSVPGTGCCRQAPAGHR